MSYLIKKEVLTVNERPKIAYIGYVSRLSGFGLWLINCLLHEQFPKADTVTVRKDREHPGDGGPFECMVDYEGHFYIIKYEVYHVPNCEMSRDMPCLDHYYKGDSNKA